MGPHKIIQVGGLGCFLPGLPMRYAYVLGEVCQVYARKMRINLKWSIYYYINAKDNSFVIEIVSDFLFFNFTFTCF